MTFLALAFRSPSADSLISLALLVCVLALVGWVLVTFVVKSEPWRAILYAVAALIGAVVLLQTFTTWGG